LALGVHRTGYVVLGAYVELLASNEASAIIPPPRLNDACGGPWGARDDGPPLPASFDGDRSVCVERLGMMLSPTHDSCLTSGGWLADMLRNRSSHLRAILQALLVTFLWSTSWVLIKIGLQDLPPLTFAGLRYILAFLCLLPLLLRSVSRGGLSRLARGRWLELVLLGLMFYAVTQGASFLALAYLPAMMVSLLWNLTTVAVALVGIWALAEPLTILQWAGVVLNLGGVLVYFYPVAAMRAEAVGLLAVLLGVLANAGSSILGRRINRRGDIDPLSVTAVSMGIGAVVLLTTGLAAQGLPPLSARHWMIIAWLAVVNTAFAFTLWNRTLRTLTAVESSIINGTMLGQIAVLAWLFLGEHLTSQRVLGLLLAGVGTLMVNLRWRKRGS